MARALISCWNDIAEELGTYGTILDFRRAWVRPDQAKDGIWAQAAEILIAKEFARHAIIMMKAFLLEYEGMSSRLFQLMREKRQRAMVRHYRNIFGVRPLPGQAGKEGWLFRVPDRLQGLLTQPEIQKGSEFA